MACNSVVDRGKVGALNITPTSCGVVVTSLSCWFISGSVVVLRPDVHVDKTYPFSSMIFYNSTVTRAQEATGSK